MEKATSIVTVFKTILLVILKNTSAPFPLKFLTSQPKLPTALSAVAPEAARTELHPDKITSPAVTPLSTAAPPLKNFRRVLIKDMSRRDYHEVSKCRNSELRTRVGILGSKALRIIFVALNEMVKQA